MGLNNFLLNSTGASSILNKPIMPEERDAMTEMPMFGNRNHKFDLIPVTLSPVLGSLF